MYASPPRLLMNRTAWAPSPRVDFRIVCRIIRPTVNWVIESRCTASKGSARRFLPSAVRFASPSVGSPLRRHNDTRSCESCRGVE